MCCFFTSNATWNRLQEFTVFLSDVSVSVVILIIQAIPFSISPVSIPVAQHLKLASPPGFFMWV